MDKPPFGAWVFVRWELRNFRSDEVADDLFPDANAKPWGRWGWPGRWCWVWFCCCRCWFFASNFFCIICVRLRLLRKNIAKAPISAMPSDKLRAVSFTGRDRRVSLESSAGNIPFSPVKLLYIVKRFFSGSITCAEKSFQILDFFISKPGLFHNTFLIM